MWCKEHLYAAKHSLLLLCRLHCCQCKARGGALAASQVLGRCMSPAGLQESGGEQLVRLAELLLSLGQPGQKLLLAPRAKTLLPVRQPLSAACMRWEWMLSEVFWKSVQA